MTKHPPLQTHDQRGKDRWIPPVDPSGFCVYEQSDRELCEYMRKPGTIVPGELLPYYDVRERDSCDLLGYTKQNPVEWFERQRSTWMDLRVMTSPRNHFGARDTGMYNARHAEEGTEVISIEVNFFRVSYNVSRNDEPTTHTFISWFVEPHQAHKLAIADWLLCLGEDHKDRFIHDLTMKAYEKHESRFRY